MMDILTDHNITAMLYLLSTHLRAGIRTPLNGHKRPFLLMVFLCPLKTQALICLVLSIMVGCIEQPFKRLTCAYAGSTNLIHSAAMRLVPLSGGYLLHIGDHNHVTK